MKKLALILAVALWAMPAVAGMPSGDSWTPFHLVQPDVLQPDHSGFSGDLSGASERDYAAIVKSVFKDAFARDVRARVIIVAPLTGGEYSIAIKQRAGRFRVTAAHSTKWLWRYTGLGKAQAVRFKDRLVPADYREVELERCSAPIDVKLGTDIVAVWQAMLAHVETHDWYDPPSHGARLYFSTVSNNRILAGQTWATSGGERVGTLILIADALNQYCLHQKREFVTELRAEVDRLLPILKAEK